MVWCGGKGATTFLVRSVFKKTPRVIETGTLRHGVVYSFVRLPEQQIHACHFGQCRNEAVRQGLLSFKSLLYCKTSKGEETNSSGGQGLYRQPGGGVYNLANGERNWEKGQSGRGSKIHQSVQGKTRS